MTSRGAAERRIPGFTLLEVLASLAIFAAGAIGLAGAYSNVLQNQYNASRVLEIAGDLRTVRALLLTEPDLKKVERGSDLYLPTGIHLQWSATIEPT